MQSRIKQRGRGERMTKVLIIRTCKECPSIRASLNMQSLGCSRIKRSLGDYKDFAESGYPIPEWCPLPDAKESEAE